MFVQFGHQVPVTREKWVYLPWKWAARFGHDGWLKLELRWFWYFRHDLPDENNERQASRRASRLNEQTTRRAIDSFYKELREEGAYPKGLPLSPAEVYEEALAKELQNRAVRSLRYKRLSHHTNRLCMVGHKDTYTKAKRTASVGTCCGKS